jgi:hypothetical protein
VMDDLEFRGRALEHHMLLVVAEGRGPNALNAAKLEPLRCESAATCVRILEVHVVGGVGGGGVGVAASR